MENYFIGLDLSLNGTGLVAINENIEIIEKKLIKSNVKDIIEDRYINISHSIMSILKSLKPIQKIYIEGLSYGSSGSNGAQLAGIHFITRTEIRRTFQFDNYVNGKLLLTYSDLVKIVPPTTLKKFITGKGQCKKNLMLLNVFKKFGETFDDDNLADAYSLARLALFDFNKTKEKENKNG